MTESFFEESFKSSLEIFSDESEYESCTFSQINLSDQNLCKLKFIECEFIDCNLSNANLNRSSFQDCTFANCKMLGLHFEEANTFNFSIHIKDSQLDHSSFYKLSLSNSSFHNSSMQAVDLIESDLSNSSIIGCNLLDAQFENTNLEKCKLENSFNFQIDPEINQLKGAQFSQSQLIGLLSKFGIKVID